MVAGEVVATDEIMNNVRGFPSEKKLAEKVLPLPDAVHGKTLIASNHEIAPCQEADKVVKVSITHGRWKLLSMKDNFSLIDAAGEPFAGGAHITERKSLRVVLGETSLVLKDKDNKPLALAIEDMSAQHKAYVIGGLTPMFDDDEVMGKEGDLDFYPMFKVRDIDDTHLDFRSLLVWNGNHFKPFLRIVPAQNLPDHPCNDTVPPKKGDNLVVDPNDLEKVYAIMTKTSTGILGRIAGWDLIVAPGADVGCMVILCAIMDDMVGWFAEA